jgi:hypothetical protein
VLLFWCSFFSTILGFLSNTGSRLSLSHLVLRVETVFLLDAIIFYIKVQRGGSVKASLSSSLGRRQRILFRFFLRAVLYNQVKEVRSRVLRRFFKVFTFDRFFLHGLTNKYITKYLHLYYRPSRFK